MGGWWVVGPQRPCSERQIKSPKVRRKLCNSSPARSLAHPPSSCWFPSRRQQRALASPYLTAEPPRALIVGKRLNRCFPTSCVLLSLAISERLWNHGEEFTGQTQNKTGTGASKGLRTRIAMSQTVLRACNHLQTLSNPPVRSHGASKRCPMLFLHGELVT